MKIEKVRSFNSQLRMDFKSLKKRIDKGERERFEGGVWEMKKKEKVRIEGGNEADKMKLGALEGNKAAHMCERVKIVCKGMDISKSARFF